MNRGSFGLLARPDRWEKLRANLVHYFSPYMGKAYGAFSLQGGSKGAVIENRDIMEPHHEEYIAFIDELIRAARNLCAPTAQSDEGLGGDRFRGLRGG
jgi:hypothetical protein